MKVQGRWIRLDVDWQQSAMFDDMSPAERLAWVLLLCEAKSHGTGGVISLRPIEFARRMRLDRDCVTNSFSGAEAHGALQIERPNSDDGRWTLRIVNWKRYQESTAVRTERGQRSPEDETNRSEDTGSLVSRILEPKTSNTRKTGNTKTHYIDNDSDRDRDSVDSGRGGSGGEGPAARLPRPGRARSTAGGARSTIAWSRDEGWQGVTASDHAVWSEAYPSVDAEGELARANAWLLANPSRAGKRNWRAFLTRWMARIHDRGGSTPPAQKHTPQHHKRGLSAARDAAGDTP